MKLFQAIKENDVFAVESIIKRRLERNPMNIQLWLKLCLTELQFPFEDYNSALECIKKVYDISPCDLDALIIEAGIKWHSFGFIDTTLFKRLKETVVEDRRKKSIIYYIQSLYYRAQNDVCEEKKYLKKSIDTCADYVYPCERYGNILQTESRTDESKVFFKMALKNVIKVYQMEDFYDFTDVETYIAEFITGTAISNVNYNVVKKLAEL